MRVLSRRRIVNGNLHAIRLHFVHFGWGRSSHIRCVPWSAAIFCCCCCYCTTFVMQMCCLGFWELWLRQKFGCQVCPIYWHILSNPNSFTMRYCWCANFLLTILLLARANFLRAILLIGSIFSFTILLLGHAADVFVASLGILALSLHATDWIPGLLTIVLLARANFICALFSWSSQFSCLLFSCLVTLKMYSLRVCESCLRYIYYIYCV